MFPTHPTNRKFPHFIWRPGDTSASGDVYATWDELIEAIECNPLEAVIVLDPRLSTDFTITSRPTPYKLRGSHWSCALPGYQAGVVIEDGTSFNGLPAVVDSVAFDSQTSDSLVRITGSDQTMVLRNGAGWNASNGTYFCIIVDADSSCTLRAESGSVFRGDNGQLATVDVDGTLRLESAGGYFFDDCVQSTVGLSLTEYVVADGLNAQLAIRPAGFPDVDGSTTYEDALEKLIPYVGTIDGDAVLAVTGYATPYDAAGVSATRLRLPLGLSPRRVVGLAVFVHSNDMDTDTVFAIEKNTSDVGTPIGVTFAPAETGLLRSPIGGVTWEPGETVDVRVTSTEDGGAGGGAGNSLSFTAVLVVR